MGLCLLPENKLSDLLVLKKSHFKVPETHVESTPPMEHPDSANPTRQPSTCSVPGEMESTAGRALHTE